MISKCFMLNGFLATLVLAPFVSYAQSNQGTEQLEEIVVTGVRAQNRAVIEQKQNAIGISDFLSSDELGRLPDFNLADAIRRAPGINTIFDEDEGQFVAARGLNADFVHTTFDGGSVATADLGSFFGQGRRVLLESVPAGAVGNIAIMKTRSVQTDGQAMGAHVDLQTRSAFDHDGQFFVATAFVGNYTDQDVPSESEDPSYRSDITWSNVFGANDEWGISLTGSFNRKKRDQQRRLPHIVNAFYSPVDGSVSSGVAGDLPYGRLNIESGYTNTVDRIGGVAKIEFRPSDQLSASLTTILFSQEEDEQRNQFATFRFCGAACEPTGVNGTSLIFGGIDDGAGGLNTPFGGLRADNWNHQKELAHTTFRLDYDINDADSISFNASVSDAQYDIPNRTVLAFSTIPTGTWVTDHSGGSIRTILDDPSLTDDASDYAATTPGSFTDQHNFDDQTVSQFRLDYVHNEGDGFGWVAGLSQRDADRNWHVDQTVYPYVGAGTFADFTASGGSFSINDGDFTFPIIDVPALDFAGARDGSNADWGPGVNNPQNGNDIDVDEAVFAAYAGFTYQGNNWYLEGGLRYEQTDVDSRPFNNDTQEFVNESSDYSNVLPNLTYSYDVADNVIFRAAVSQSIGRPSHSQINGSISTNVDPVTGITTIVSGNINLEPRISTNYDVGVEVYFDDGDSIISAALFRKDIEDEIFNRTIEVSPTTNVITFVNAEDASVEGVELLLIKNSFDFLPGALSNFGASMNYSIFSGQIDIDASATLHRLLEQPDNILNVSLFYKSERFEGRVSYNETGSQLKLNEPQGSPNENFDDKREFLDAQLRFDLTDRWILLAEGRNLTNEPEQTRFVQFPQYIPDSSTFGRSYWIGATFTY